MKYAIVTVKWCESHGILVPEHARRSLDGSKVIFHYDFIAPVITEKDKIEVYNHNDSSFWKILNSEEWVEQESLDNIS